MIISKWDDEVAQEICRIYQRSSKLRKQTLDALQLIRILEDDVLTGVVTLGLQRRLFFMSSTPTHSVYILRRAKDEVCAKVQISSDWKEIEFIGFYLVSELSEINQLGDRGN